ncbi:MAG TPA: hypothetical protein VNB64_02095 [Solirubrobacteraceae bacterium]|nr:hypothetical protein [Solirubrobacteraceae bacterium]
MSRFLPAFLALLATLVLAAPASAFPGATVRGTEASATYAGVHLLVRVVCPPRTQATTRPGDFSFCRGTGRFYVGSRLVATGPFSVRTFDSHIERMNVLAGARSLFRPGRRPRVTWVIASHDGQGQTATNRGLFSVFNPFKR